MYVQTNVINTDTNIGIDVWSSTRPPLHKKTSTNQVQRLSSTDAANKTAKGIFTHIWKWTFDKWLCQFVHLLLLPSKGERAQLSSIEIPTQFTRFGW